MLKIKKHERSWKVREILFKAKQIDNGEWVIGHYIPFGLDIDIHYDIVFSKGLYFCNIPPLFPALPLLVVL